jgi:hypothetical protein
VLLGIALASGWESSNDPDFEFQIDDGVNTNCPEGKFLDSRGFCVSP